MQSSTSKIHHGKISKIEKNKLGKTTGYYIKENDKEYFAHLGDIKTTAYLIYKIRDHKVDAPLELENFEEGDSVDFEVFGDQSRDEQKKHAINVSHSTK